MFGRLGLALAPLGVGDRDAGNVDRVAHDRGLALVARRGFQIVGLVLALDRPRGSDLPGGLEFEGRRGSGLLRSLLRRAVAPFRHELIEFRLVLGLAQACKEVPELALLVLQALERIGAVFVEGAVAA
jgi:hypothetical protein